MRLEKRSAFGWPGTAAGYAPCKNGLVVHYDGSNQGLAGKSHSSCRAYWKATRRFHMGPSRGWRDIGYSFGVCPHGYVLEGRGWQREQAAQPGGNTTWTSCTFMTGDAEEPTSAQVAAFKELRAWLRGEGLGAGVKGHRDFISTSCPGSILYGMVKSGALVEGAGEEDDMPSEKDLWTWDGIPAPINPATGKTLNPDNTTWRPDSYLKNIFEELRRARGEIAATQAAVGELAKTVAALATDRGEAVDADALIARIQAAIEGVTVRLDVQSGAEDAS